MNFNNNFHNKYDIYQNIHSAVQTVMAALKHKHNIT